MTVMQNAAEELSQMTGMARAGEGRKLTTKKIISWNELEALRSSWESLLRNSTGSTIFSTPEWLGAWWRAFARDQKLAAIAFVNSTDEIVGIAPLYRDRLSGPLNLSLRRLRLVGDGSRDSDNLDLIIGCGYEESCVHTLLDWLDSEPGWDVCELNTLPLDSASVPQLMRDLKDRQWTYRQLERPRSTISLPDTWEGYLGQISKKEKTKINYYTNRLKRRFEVGFYRCTDEAELGGCLESLFELHQKRWELRGMPGSFASPERRKFYYEMAASFLKRKWLEFWLLKLTNKTVAAQFGFRYRDAVFSLQEGFDPALSSDRVGYLLRAHVLKTLIDEGVRFYDFLGGEDPSKDRWGARLSCYVDVHFARPHSRGSAYLKLDEATRESKTWLKTNLPSPAFRMARLIYHTVRGIKPADDNRKPKAAEEPPKAPEEQE